MTVNLSLLGGAGWQFSDNNGSPLSGGLLYTYQAGTALAANTYTSASGVTPNSNPVVLNAAGRVVGEIWLTQGQAYKFVLKTSAGVTLGTYDNVPGANDLTALNTFEAALAAPTGSSLVGFIQSGTGAVATTVQAKLRESVSVKDFGAVGNGVADDTAAFNLALNSGALYVNVPFGTYLISSTISIPAINVTLSGPTGGTQAYQCATISHSVSSTGSLLLVDSAANGGVCIKNLKIIGGNGSFCVSSSRPYVRYEYLYMENYNGGGIQLLSSSGGSSSSKIANCEWVGPNSATAYTGFEIAVNGGDVLLDSCTAIRGAIGINVIQGQTVILNRCSLNQQSRNPNIGGGAKSSATQFNTAGIKLSGSGAKQAISIRNCYIETCDNGVYVESCESLSIADNWFADNGCAGNSGAWTAVGNSAINLVNNSANNVSILNNRFQCLSNGTAGSPFYGIYFNSASNVFYANNYFEISGDYSGEYVLTTSNTVTVLNNTNVEITSTPVLSVDTNNRINSLDVRNGFNNYSQNTQVLTNTWVDVVIAPNSSLWKVYASDFVTAGNLLTEATVAITNTGTTSVVYQTHTGAVTADVQVAAGKIQIRSSGATIACMYSVQRVI
jgi:hypothetical protein